MEDRILEALNKCQRDAVEYCEGASLVIAGAGSGKTRVLTHKIAYLLKNGYAPWNILALTFTNKAAKEMKERIGALVGYDDARRLNMGTFHSVFSRILRAEASLLGYNRNFTIYDQGDSRSLIKNIIKEMCLDDKTYKANMVSDRISMAKNRLITSHLYASSSTTIREDVLRRMPLIKDIYIRYSARCRQANAMDFDDLLLNTYYLLNDNDDIRRKYADIFKYVLVDEYQDTNYAQQAIIIQLTKEHQKICVVGDDAQSIYGFRGADIDNILGFTNLYTNAKIFKLEQNYRSTKYIVQAANSLIKHNARQIPKDTFSEKEQGDRLVVKPAYSDMEEALIVCRDIMTLKRADNCDFSDFAILYRTNSQSRSFEECMRKMNIPYRIFGGLSFYQRKEIKDVIAYFRLVVNPDDEEALRRIINYPTRGIGETTLNKIIEKANEYNVSLWRIVESPEYYGLKVGKTVLAKLANFREMISSWLLQATTVDAYTLGKEIIINTGIMKDIASGKEPEDIARQENIVEILAAMQNFVTEREEEDKKDNYFLDDYLQEVSLLSEQDSEENETPKVSLMTIHSAKGLEFPNVFVVGVEENIFPSPLSCNSMRELEEERRLLYVAVTRAEKRCIITCAQNRFRYGRMEYDTPSRFIKDFDPSLIKIVSRHDTYSAEYRSPNVQKDYYKSITSKQPIKRHSSYNSDSSVTSKSNIDGVYASNDTERITKGQLYIGVVIEHQRFGRGTITNMEGCGENLKATVNFEHVGIKQLLLKFARYKIVK